MTEYLTCKRCGKENLVYIERLSHTPVRRKCHFCDTYYFARAKIVFEYVREGLAGNEHLDIN